MGSAMAAAPVIAEFPQQSPPRGGYSVDHFRQQLDGMARHLRQMLAAGDPRAVFQCTYLTFSRQVLAASEAGRFHERAWATDMCCRFVDAYLEQLRRWEHGDPGQCLAWRTAFSAAAAGRRNVL
jgi:hypothetical protein